jgi:hypothetical protein
MAEPKKTGKLNAWGQPEYTDEPDDRAYKQGDKVDFNTEEIVVSPFGDSRVKSKKKLDKQFNESVARRKANPTLGDKLDKALGIEPNIAKKRSRYYGPFKGKPAATPPPTTVKPPRKGGGGGPKHAATVPAPAKRVTASKKTISNIGGSSRASEANYTTSSPSRADPGYTYGSKSSAKPKVAAAKKKYMANLGAKHTTMLKWFKGKD